MALMKFNPFRPGSVVSPGMFIGRTDELDTIEQCLFQAKHGNPQHFLIEGERGIGKTSLMHYTEVLARGEVNPLRTKQLIKFLTLPVDIGSAQSQIDIVRALAREWKRAISEHDALKANLTTVWNFLSSWEILGFGYYREDIDPDDAREELAVKFRDMLNASSEYVDGVFVVIDEADAPEPSAKLGEFLKFFTEQLHQLGCNNVLFGLAGLPSTIPKLRGSHRVISAAL